MSKPADRFGIGSLDAYDDIITQKVIRPAQIAGTLDALTSAAAQKPVTAQSLIPTVPTLRDAFEDRREQYRGILGDSEEQKRQTQAQILFDLANTALAFSTPGSRAGMSPAERLAEAAVQTKLFPTIGARAQAAQEQKQKVDLAALQSAETTVAAKEKAAADLRKTLAGQKPEYMRVRFSDGSQKVFDVNTTMGARSFQRATQQPGAQAFKVGTEPTPPKPSAASFKVVVDKEGKQVGQFDLSVPAEKKAMQDMLKANPSYQMAGVPTAPQIERPLGDQDYFNKFGVTKEKFESLPQATQDILMGIPTITDKDYFIKFGMDKQQFLSMPTDNRNFLIGLPVLTDKDYFKKFGLTKAGFEGLEQEDRDVLLGLPTLTDENYFTKFGMDKASFLALDEDVKNRILNITPKPIIKTDALGRLIDVTVPEAPKIIFGTKKVVKPKLQVITIDGVPQVVDIMTDEGMARVDAANEANRQQVGRAMISNVSVAPAPKSFIITLENGDLDFVTSYDNGVTFTDKNGERQSVQQFNGVPTSDTIADKVNKSIRSARKAGEKLEELDQQIANALGANPDEFSREDIVAAKDALDMARIGTGFWSNFWAAADGIFATIPFVPNEFIAYFTEDNQEARQFLRGVNVLGRSALVVNPKFPVAEMQKVEELFVRPETIFVNPANEAKKFIELKTLATQQYGRNLEELKKRPSEELRKSITQNNFELQRLLSLLETVPLPGQDDGGDSLVQEATTEMFSR